MTIGKNKRLSRGGKKSLKKKITDPMLSKEWYDVVAPATFTVRNCGKTIATKSKGTYIAADSLKGRVFQFCLADLMKGKADDKGPNITASDDKIHKARNVKLRAEEVMGRSVLTNFHGMSMTTDSLRVLPKKKLTLIEGEIEGKTSDGYGLRVFVIATTPSGRAQQRQQQQQQQQAMPNGHIKTAKVKKIRQKMYEIITKTVTKNPLEKVVKSLQQDTMGEDIKKACRNIGMLETANIRKVKVVRTPKHDIGRLVEAHGGQEHIPSSQEGGRQMIQEEDDEPEPQQEEVAEADD